VLDASTGVAIGSFPWTGTVGVDPHNKLRIGSNHFIIDDSKAATDWILRVVKSREDVLRAARSASASERSTTAVSRPTVQPKTATTATARPPSEEAPRWRIPVVGLVLVGIAIYGLARYEPPQSPSSGCSHRSPLEGEASEPNTFVGLGIGYCEPGYSDR
jgi:hypothetical protein